ncbi:MAG: diaminopimelate epimerase [Desulfotalea sp.]
MKESLFFTKMSGAGNDFIIIDNRDDKFSAEQRRELAIELCRRAFSVGANGLIFIQNKTQDDVDFTWDFINSDGSRGEMCGNGARCVARYAYEKKIAPAELSFATLVGVIKAKVNADKTVSIEMTIPEDYRQGLSISIDEQEYVLDHLDTGVPHGIVYLAEDKDINDVPMAEWGSFVRYHKLFEPRGCNANFVKVLPESNTIFVRTYERGVEAETMACGTAAVAAAICAHKRYGLKSPVKIATRGGDLLTISFVENVDFKDMAPKLSGPAKIIYEAELSRE